MKLLGVIVVAALAGCTYPLAVEHQDYPLDWPRPAAADHGCPDLSGRYRNQSDASGPALARLALPDTSTPMAQIEIVELEGPKDGTLSLKFHAPAASGRGGPLELGRRQWRQGEDFLCEQGWLILSKTKIAPLPAVVVKDAARLTLTTDGSLVVENRQDGGGLLVVFPSYMSFRNWQLYRRVGR